MSLHRKKCSKKDKEQVILCRNQHDDHKRHDSLTFQQHQFTIRKRSMVG
jgi:hypothetical protein